jgi:hypothetical protein
MCGLFAGGGRRAVSARKMGERFDQKYFQERGAP